MSDQTNDGVYLVIPFSNGNYGTRLTVGSASVAGVQKHLTDLLDVDETDPEGFSAMDSILDSVVTIEAAIALKMPKKETASAPQVAPANVPAGKSCNHGPMKFKEGISSRNQKPYKGYFCQAPYGSQKCDAIFIN